MDAGCRAACAPAPGRARVCNSRRGAKAAAKPGGYARRAVAAGGEEKWAIARAAISPYKAGLQLMNLGRGGKRGRKRGRERETEGGRGSERGSERRVEKKEEGDIKTQRLDTCGRVLEVMG